MSYVYTTAFPPKDWVTSDLAFFSLSFAPAVKEQQQKQALNRLSAKNIKVLQGNYFKVNS